MDDQKGLLEQKQFAETCYRAAFQFYTQEDNPSEWADIQINLGVVLCELADFAKGATNLRLLEQSAEAYHAALMVFTQEHSPILWAVIQANLSATLSSQAYWSKEQHVQTYLDKQWMFVVPHCHFVHMTRIQSFGA